MGRSKRSPPSKGGIGIAVRYCGHDAAFLADIHIIGDTCVVVAAEPIIGGKGLSRPAQGATHHLLDFPVAGYWAPHKGLFVVPSDQVVLIADGT